ncbi:LOW QUALITY PROTEIN: hypothetical protein NC653_040976 [Populus alba x Populus x berolinensis]|uniref:t-SNARE coiled-coil homology domain-containing protein n=1 Tax=Populus alba x Populus x berolinensis TaxID=444605 RepID=A0AAD6L8D5_9ROSI|nr:LOW QUALITY PROTEIN: hypothetical protein NC653_040976 [Populus alba x Populus x berolinensis]
MALMVEAQGEQMDDIEHHVLKASHYVKDGTKELKSAKDHQKSSRKWMCIEKHDPSSFYTFVWMYRYVMEQHHAPMIDWILQNLCTVDRVKKPVSGVRILQDKFPTSFLDSVWNLCNWQSKVLKVGFRPLVMNHFPTKSTTLKFLTRMAGSGTEFQHQTSKATSDEPLPNEICNIKVLDKKGRIRDGIPEHQASEMASLHQMAHQVFWDLWVCIEAISDFRDYQLRISNVSTNDKKAKIVCGVAVLISVVAENLKNSAWIDDFYRSLPASDAFRYTGSCTNLCTVDRVKKPVSGVRILQDKFPTSLLDSSKVSKVGFRPLVMNHFPTKSATLKFLTRMAGSGTEFQHQTSEYLRASQEKEQNSPSIQSYQAS